jgi:hypothetical protein
MALLIVSGISGIPLVDIDLFLLSGRMPEILVHEWERNKGASMRKKSFIIWPIFAEMIIREVN